MLAQRRDLSSHHSTCVCMRYTHVHITCSHQHKWAPVYIRIFDLLFLNDLGEPVAAPPLTVSMTV